MGRADRLNTVTAAAGSTPIRAAHEAVWHAFAATHKGCPDLSADGQPKGRPLLLGHTKIESTVRYLGIEVDDALAISEQVDV
jgi:hypothetical protein